MELYKAIEGGYLERDDYRDYLLMTIDARCFDSLMRAVKKFNKGSEDSSGMSKTLLIFLDFYYTRGFLVDELQKYLKTLSDDVMISIADSHSNTTAVKYFIEELAMRYVVNNIHLKEDTFKSKVRYYIYIRECLSWCIDIDSINQAKYYMDELSDADNGYIIMNLQSIVSMCKYKEVYDWYFKYCDKRGYNRINEAFSLVTAISDPTDECITMFEILKEYVDLNELCIRMIENDDYPDHDTTKYLLKVEGYKFDYERLLNISRYCDAEEVKELILEILGQV